MQTCSIKCNYSSNKVGAFLNKSSSCTKHNWRCVIGFFCSPQLIKLIVNLILHYYLGFCREIYFFECLYFSEYDIRMYWRFFWLRNGPLIKYVRNCWLWWGSTAAHREDVCVSSFMCTYTLTLFSCFWQHFCLIVSCFIYRNLTSPLFKKDVFVRNGYFFSKEINFCRDEIGYFYLNIFSEPKLAK